MGWFRNRKRVDQVDFFIEATSRLPTPEVAESLMHWWNAKKENAWGVRLDPYLELEDGIFGGRRGEGALAKMTHIVARPHKLIIEFDEQFYFLLTEPRVSPFKDHHDEIRIAYGQLVIDSQGYGHMNPHVDVYKRQGIMKLVR